MKLHPPEVDIPEEDPFKNALFNRKEFAQSLTALLRNVEESLVIFVNAPWGEGKTTFARMWMKELERLKIKAIHFDAYAADYFDDPFVSFTGEILELVDKRLAAAKGVPESRKEFKKTAIEVGKRLGGLVGKIALKAATLNAIEAAHIDELKDISTTFAEGVSEIGGDLIEKKIEGYVSEKDALKAFKESLKALAAIVREEQEFPLTIIVDELDRCRPDFALQLLERIKHLFDVEGVAFVLLVNRDQIEAYVRAVYGANVDARSYLLKFGTLFVDLPTERQQPRSQTGRSLYCRALSEHFGTSKTVRDGEYLADSISALGTHFQLTLRETEKVFAILSVFYSVTPKEVFREEFLVSLLTVLKLRNPNFYQKISSGPVDATTFLNESTIFSERTDENGGFQWDYVKGLVRFFLLPDGELQRIVSDNNSTDPVKAAHHRYGRFGGFTRSRNLVLSSLCARLDQFSFRVPND